MLIIDRVLDRIDTNSYKKHNCIPFNGMPRFCEWLPGIEQANYYIVSGASGAGKTQIGDHMFVFNAIDFIEDSDTDINLKIFYYSQELSAEAKMMQWVSRRLYTHHGLRLSPKQLDSIGDFRVDNMIKMAAKECRNYFAKMENDYLRMYDGAVNPQAIINDLENYAKSNGKVVKRREVFKHHDAEGNTVDKEVEVFDHYEANNPNEYVLIIVDHMSLLNEERGQSIKQTIEKLSTYMVKARNRYKYIPVMIQQQTAEKENLDHFKSSKLEPSKDGLGESKLTYNDCDVALGIFQPQKHEIKSYRGYNVIEMQDSYRNLSIFKNRFGSSNINVGLYFDGAVNYFRELPKSDNMTSTSYDMVKKRKPNW